MEKKDKASAEQSLSSKDVVLITSLMERTVIIKAELKDIAVQLRSMENKDLSSFADWTDLENALNDFTVYISAVLGSKVLSHIKNN